MVDLPNGSLTLTDSSGYLQTQIDSADDIIRAHEQDNESVTTYWTAQTIGRFLDGCAGNIEAVPWLEPRGLHDTVALSPVDHRLAQQRDHTIRTLHHVTCAARTARHTWRWPPRSRVTGGPNQSGGSFGEQGLGHLQMQCSKAVGLIMCPFDQLLEIHTRQAVVVRGSGEQDLPTRCLGCHTVAELLQFGQRRESLPPMHHTRGMTCTRHDDPHGAEDQ
jgi:hypothetical protein